MIKVSVMYPHTPGARFDHDYYRNRHMPMVAGHMGSACLSYSVDRGLSGGAPGSAPAYEAMCHILCESVAAFQAAFGPHVKTIMADVPHYTDIKPVMQVSEVMAG